MENKVSISVVIPVYNGENYIMECLHSVLHQTYQDFEIIVVNDGSTDATLLMVDEMKKYTDKIRCFTIENHGQGYARNYALPLCQGEYVCFVDADDKIEPCTLELAYKRICEDGSDLVVFDWKYYNGLAGTYIYNNTESYFSKRLLEGEECLALLETSPIFTVNKLYSKAFLLEHDIRYGEGYIYEDNPFWVKVCVHARLVSLIHSPLYSVRISKTSSTKTNYDSDWHCSSFIKAIKEAFGALGPTEKEEYASLYYYFFDKFCLYYDRRTPNHLKKQFLHDFVDVMAARQLAFAGNSPFYEVCLKRRIFSRRRYRTFRTMLFLRFKLFTKARNFFDRLKNFLKRVVKRIFRRNRKLSHYEVMLRQSLFRDVILFMGFDHRYTGNSRYLFEQMVQAGPQNVKLFFATNDPRVPSKYRLDPESARFQKFLARSKVIVFESWIPLNIRKRVGTVWIQLWHGTPLKKMLFDSEESDITLASPRHKNNKFLDIQRWDALITDTPQANRYFETSMLLPSFKIFSFGYPRVKYLLDHAGDPVFKKRLKQIHHIPEDAKVIVYLPTWRDYNYSLEPSEYDMAYQLDLPQLLAQLQQDNCIILHKKHQYKDKDTPPEMDDDRIRNAQDIETQELLLLADCLITDYSSVMFDAFAMDLPVVIYANDFEKYQKSRSVYPDLWQMLVPFVNETVSDTAKMIRQYPMGTAYQKVKSTLSYQNTQGDLVQWVKDKLMLPL